MRVNYTVDIGPVSVAGHLETPVVLLVGLSGPQGPTGPMGPVPDLAYHHEQQTVSALWVIEHNLGYTPSGLMVFDSAGNMVEGHVLASDDNQIEIEFAAGFAGYATLS